MSSVTVRAHLTREAGPSALFLALGVASLAFAPSPTGARAETLEPPIPGYQLVWSDEFEGTSLDPSKFRPSRLGPIRNAVNTSDAITVHDGVLSVRAFTENGRHSAAYLDTEGRFAATYGLYQARIRFRSAPGEWCAFWLLSPTVGNPVGDPGRAGTEVDIVEHRAQDQRLRNVLDEPSFTIHWDGYDRRHKMVAAHVPAPRALRPLQGEWHTYAVLWTDREYRFFVDGAELWKTAKAVSRRSQFVLFSCEVEDGGYAGRIPPAGYGPRSTSQVGMDVDWVRLWQRAPAPAKVAERERPQAPPQAP